MEKQESLHQWLPAEDDLQLVAVELALIRQGHDALLVAVQVGPIHLLNTNSLRLNQGC